MRREWRHRTKVYKRNGLWFWDCGICVWSVVPLKYPSQIDAFQAASNHAYLGGYRLVE